MDKKQKDAKPQPGGNNTGDASDGDQNTSSGDQQDGASSEGVTFTTEQQAYLNQLVGQVRAEGREAGKREAETAQTRAAEQQTNRQLADQQQYKELADRLQLQLDQLRPKAEERDQLVSQMQTEIDAEIGSLPTALRELMPENLNVSSMWGWMRRAQKAAPKFMQRRQPQKSAEAEGDQDGDQGGSGDQGGTGGGENPAPGNSGGPARSGNKDRATLVREGVAELEGRLPF